MIFKDFQGKKLSALGLGTMRLPQTPEGKIDETATAEMVAYAIDHGVNYFDTAWGYHNGESETVMGRVLSAYPREKFYLATKFPGYDTSNMGHVASIFEEQLKKCRVDYFDFYLFHNVCEANIDMYLDPQYGILDYLLKQKENGRIKHLGFSVHASNATTRRFLAAYGAHMEFGQVQLNYLDWHFQSAKEKIELISSYGIPIWVMEPLRGGKLATLDATHAEKLAALRPEETAPGWAFRFLQSFDQVKMILSGMSNLAQLKENVEIFKENKPLNGVEKQALLQVADEMVRKIVLPCTSCRYCVEKCPKGLDIPYLLTLYNEHCFTQGGFLAPMALDAMPKEKWPHACIACGACAKVCPQKIKIPGALAYFVAKLSEE